MEFETEGVAIPLQQLSQQLQNQLTSLRQQITRLQQELQTAIEELSPMPIKYKLSS